MTPEQKAWEAEMLAAAQAAWDEATPEERDAFTKQQAEYHARAANDPMEIEARALEAAGKLRREPMPDAVIFYMQKCAREERAERREFLLAHGFGCTMRNGEVLETCDMTTLMNLGYLWDQIEALIESGHIKPDPEFSAPTPPSEAQPGEAP
jgi:hypothetical protein